MNEKIRTTVKQELNEIIEEIGSVSPDTEWGLKAVLVHTKDAWNIGYEMILIENNTIQPVSKFKKTIYLSKSEAIRTLREIYLYEMKNLINNQKI